MLLFILDIIENDNESLIKIATDEPKFVKDLYDRASFTANNSDDWSKYGLSDSNALVMCTLPKLLLSYKYHGQMVFGGERYCIVSFAYGTSVVYDGNYPHDWIGLLRMPNGHEIADQIDAERGTHCTKYVVPIRYIRNIIPDLI